MGQIFVEKLGKFFSPQAPYVIRLTRPPKNLNPKVFVWEGIVSPLSNCLTDWLAGWLPNWMNDRVTTWIRQWLFWLKTRTSGRAKRKKPKWKSPKLFALARVWSFVWLFVYFAALTPKFNIYSFRFTPFLSVFFGHSPEPLPWQRVSALSLIFMAKA